jgi:hypothetical protein
LNIVGAGGGGLGSPAFLPSLPHPLDLGCWLADPHNSCFWLGLITG